MNDEIRQRYIQLCAESYEVVIQDKIITEREEKFLRHLHQFGKGYVEGNIKKILMDIKQIGELK